MIYFDSELRIFSSDLGESMPHYENFKHNVGINKTRDKMDKLDQKILKQGLKIRDRSAAQQWRNEHRIGAYGTRLRNWASGTGFKGDVRVNKLARLQRKKARMQAREEYHNAAKLMNLKSKERVSLKDGVE